MLFGMFFGAGNLIFPVYMGQQAGHNVWLAAAGFLVTGVGIPLLGVAALGISRSDGLLEMSSRVGKPYGIFFTSLLYLTIGPFFAIPRCASVSFTVGIEALTNGKNQGLMLALFSLAFFAAALFFSLRPGQIMTWIGKILNPLFLCFLGILVIRALTNPMGEISAIEPIGNYETKVFFQGFLEGYNTMDALAGLAFGIVVVNVIRGLGVEKPENIAKSTVHAGVFSAILMAVIYLLVSVVGAQSRGRFNAASNGGEALRVISAHYFGNVGAVILAAIVTLACLKTAVGLLTSCGETFAKMFPGRLTYRRWVIFFAIFSFLFANLGLNTIISYSVPFLMFLYPLAVTLILLTLFGKRFGNDRRVYVWVTALTAVAAIVDLLHALPVAEDSFLLKIAAVGMRILPFSDLGFGWVCPAILGLLIGLALHMGDKRKHTDGRTVTKN